jgi:hypothetical protein
MQFDDIDKFDNQAQQQDLSLSMALKLDPLK